MLKLSIILPCYNVSKYISRCLDSIYTCDLSLEEYEVICVDDCSTDITPDIIVSYIEKYVNLRLIKHIENKASGGARNTGLHMAQGEYVWYIDPDDMIYPETVKFLVDKCTEGNLDVLCFNYEDIDEQEKIISKPKVFDDTQVMKGTEFAHKCFGEEFIYHIGYVTRQIFKRKFILFNKILFPENTCWQDTVYMPHAILMADRVQGSSTFAYRYRHHDMSVCGAFKLGYSGVKTYQWAFNAGYYLLKFSRDIQKWDLPYSILFFNYARSHYINKFPIFLGRSSNLQRRLFYQQVKIHSDRVKEVYPYMNRCSKLLLQPIIGPFCAQILSSIYKFKHITAKNR